MHEIRMTTKQCAWIRQISARWKWQIEWRKQAMELAGCFSMLNPDLCCAIPHLPPFNWAICSLCQNHSLPLPNWTTQQQILYPLIVARVPRLCLHHTYVQSSQFVLLIYFLFSTCPMQFAVDGDMSATPIFSHRHITFFRQCDKDKQTARSATRARRGNRGFMFHIIIRILFAESLQPCDVLLEANGMKREKNKRKARRVEGLSSPLLDLQFNPSHKWSSANPTHKWWWS